MDSIALAREAAHQDRVSWRAALPEAYIGHCAPLFDDRGKLTNESTSKFLRTFLDAFANWIARTAG